MAEVNEAQHLTNRLYAIWLFKDRLPLKWRGSVNELGLYVQARSFFGYSEGWERLQTGGKFRSYFDARLHTSLEEGTGSWEVKRGTVDSLI